MSFKLSFCLILLFLTSLTSGKYLRNLHIKSILTPNVVYYETGGDRMLGMKYDDQKNEDTHNQITDCYMFGDKDLANEAISTGNIKPEIKIVSSKEMSVLLAECSLFSKKKIEDKWREDTKNNDDDFPKVDEFNNDVDKNFFQGLAIYPGTKWCGAGDIAEDFHDLGSEENTDVCCRAHDHCFDQMSKGENKYNLTNNAIHTKVHCDCDTQFAWCLHSANTPTSNRVGKLFFNMLQSQCFKKDFPIVKCLEYKGVPLVWKSCQKYELDPFKDPLYQFFDSKFYEVE